MVAAVVAVNQKRQHETGGKWDEQHKLDKHNTFLQHLQFATSHFFPPLSLKHQFTQMKIRVGRVFISSHSSSSSSSSSSSKQGNPCAIISLRPKTNLFQTKTKSSNWLSYFSFSHKKQTARKAKGKRSVKVKKVPSLFCFFYPSIKQQ